jgi:signal transduction histidine kinase
MASVQLTGMAGPLARRLSPAQVDLLVVAATVALSGPVLALVLGRDRAGVPAGLALLPLASVPLLWRRTHPGPALLVVSVALAVGSAVSPGLPNGVGLLFAGFAAALYGDANVRRLGGIAAAGLLAVAYAAVHASGNGRALGHLTGMALGYGVAWVLGDHTRTRHAHLAALEDRARRLERERDDHARRATEEERARLARELHDVVVHSVSVIAVQAGAVRATAPDDPQRALATLGLIESTARSTLGELRALLGILRHPEGAPPLRPQPSLGQLGDLVGTARRSGQPVTLDVRGTERPVGALVGLCAYRIVQEALTNAAKHAPGAPVRVTVDHGPDALRVTVADSGSRRPGAAVAPAGDGAGHGLVGMRERAALVGGALEAGPTPEGGFRVDAHLPNPAAP